MNNPVHVANFENAHKLVTGFVDKHIGKDSKVGKFLNKRADNWLKNNTTAKSYGKQIAKGAGKSAAVGALAGYLATRKNTKDRLEKRKEEENKQ